MNLWLYFWTVAESPRRGRRVDTSFHIPTCKFHVVLLIDLEYLDDQLT